MPIRTFFVAAAMLCALALPARAAATPEPLPQQIEAHIVVTSPYELLGNVDAYVAAATKGTANAIPPGFVGMMAQFSLPIPFDAWDSDGELHILALREEASDDPDDLNLVVVFGVPDFSAFLQSLEERDWIVGDQTGKGDFQEARPIVMPSGEAMVMADLGGGRAALGDDVASIASALAGWTPAAASDADIVAHAAMTGDGAWLRDKIFDLLRKEKSEIVHAVTDAGFKPDIARNLIAAVEKAVPAVADELAAMKSLVAELRFAGETCALDLRSGSSSGGWLREFAQTMTDADAVDTAVAGNLPPGAVAVGVSASVADIIPDAKNRLVSFASSVYGGIVPEYRDEIASLVAAFMDSGPGETAVGSYIDGTAQYNVSVNLAQVPDKMLAAVRDTFDLFNRVWASAIDDPGLGVTLAGETLGEGDAAYCRYLPVFADEAKLQALLDRLQDGREGLNLDLRQLKGFRFFVAGLENGIVSASGELTDEEFLARLAETRSRPGETLTAGPKAEALLAAMPAAQATAVVLDAGGFARMYALQLARNAGASEDQVARMGAVLERASAAEKPGENLLGFSIGAEKGWLNARLLMPAGAIARIVRDVETLRASGRRPRLDAPVPDPAGEEDEYEDDLEEEMDADEEDASAA